VDRVDEIRDLDLEDREEKDEMAAPEVYWLEIYDMESLRWEEDEEEEVPIGARDPALCVRW